jgi:predicted dehydrogenase
MSNNLTENSSSPKKENQAEKPVTKRRTLLKAMAGLPVAGLFGVGLWEKRIFDSGKRNSIVKELGLDSVDFSSSEYGNKESREKLIRVGFIGFGTRGNQLAKALGFMHPDDVKAGIKNKTLDSWFRQEYLNVAITGICDVFDMRAERGLVVAENEIRPGGKEAPNLPVKRYRTYQEMLSDKDIDAVIIATPDFHHTRMAIDAAKAGKHVYCEKSVAMLESELNELYTTVKSSGIVFQLGHQIPQSVVFKQAREIVKKGILGKITLIETTTNRNTAEGAWIRYLDANGKPKPGDEKSIDWKQWLGNTPYVPFDIERYYDWTKWFAYDTGMIGQLFTHEFDAVNQLLRIGIPKSVVSSGGIYYWKDHREMPDVLHCIFEYPDKDLTLTYSGSLSSSRDRGRIFMGHDASMELGNNAIIMADRNSDRYRKGIDSGLIDPATPMISFNPGSGQIDAVTSASEKYYADRGLSTTTINGRQVDVVHLHLREWLNCIREKGIPSANIDMAFEEGIACIMAQRSYVEKRRVEWDDINRRII